MTKLSKELAAQMYNSGNEHFKAFALENYPELDKPKYAMKWEDLGEYLNGAYISSQHNQVYTGKDYHNVVSNHCVYPTEELAKAAQVLPLLLQLRNQWWEVDGWDVGKADGWCSIGYKKGGKFVIDYWTITCHVFSFKDEQTAQLFLETFKPMLEIAKPLL